MTVSEKVLVAHPNQDMLSAEYLFKNVPQTQKVDLTHKFHEMSWPGSRYPRKIDGK